MNMTAQGTAPLFYPARPTFKLDGEDKPALTDRLVSLTTKETTAGLYHCEATFSNRGTVQNEVGYLYFDRDTFDFGTELQASIGEGASSGTVFDGRIFAIEGRFPQAKAPELLVMAEDKLQDLRMTRRTRTFEDVTASDLVEQIAGDHGLQTDVDLDGPSYRIAAQLNQSDLAFLREQVRAVDGELWIQDDTVFAHARSRRQGDEVELVYGERLFQITVCADLAGQRTTVAVGGWDVQAKEGIDEEAGDDSIRSELDEGESAANILRGSFGDRDERIVHLAPMTTGEAQAVAEAQFRRLARRFVSCRGVAEGDARLQVGGRVELGLVGRLFDGTYTVTEVTHVFDLRDGFRTYFRAERPGLGS